MFISSCKGSNVQFINLQCIIFSSSLQPPPRAWPGSGKIAKYLYPFASILISSSCKGSNVQSTNQFSSRTRGHDQAVARPRPRRQESSGNIKIETKMQIKTWFSNSSNYFGRDLHTCIQGKFLVLCSLACTAHMVDVKFSLNTFKICTEYFFKISMIILFKIFIEYFFKKRNRNLHIAWWPRALFSILHIGHLAQWKRAN